MEKLKELYEKLFACSNVEQYRKCLEEITLEISNITSKEYSPSKLNLIPSDLSAGCEAYVCIKEYEVLDLQERPIYTYRPGTVLARQLQWDRDIYLNTFPLKQYVSGGPLERPEHKLCWFPIYRQSDLRKAIEFMLELHRLSLIAVLSDPNEGFLS